MHELTFRIVDSLLTIFKLPIETHTSRSNTAITSVGARYATKINSAASLILPKRCHRFENESIMTSNCPVCRERRCSQQWYDCWSELSYASATMNTRARTNHLA